jgi:hypothetical protein
MPAAIDWPARGLSGELKTKAGFINQVMTGD